AHIVRASAAGGGDVGRATDDGSGDVVHVDGLAGLAAVAAVVGRRPGAGHAVVAGAIAGRGHVVERERHGRVAIVGRRGLGEDRRGRAVDGRRSGQRRNRRSGDVVHVDGLAGLAAIAAVVGRRPGAGHAVI